ncbi:PH domain-containing protein [Planococcus sp. YIM B11945]|uniref:PH domain-containing protein n=1 Tax=Planococcus sp. YIM B11945 TaxID=3435410 RepID=UPI003D7C37E5
METNKQRYPIASILFQFVSLVKGSFFPILYLFVLRNDTGSYFWLTIKVLFSIFFVGATVKMVLNWFFNQYEVSDKSIAIYNGVFVKKQQNIGMGRIQNVQQTTNFLHRLLKLTSLTLETGTSGDEASIKFPVLTYQEADRIKAIVEQAKLPDLHSKEPDEKTEAKEIQEQPSPLRVYFTPTNRDLIKAAFTSFSVLAIFPILFSLYSQVDDFFNLDESSKSIFSYLLSHIWLVVPIVLVALVISVLIGLLTTYLKYGKFEISADNDRIYIKKGISTESRFSIQKNKVQAIKLEQSILKKWLGMVEVSLLSAGSVGDEDVQTNSLFPFLPVKKAYGLIGELLPDYEISENMKPLSKNVLWLRLIRPYYFWAAATAALLYFKIEWAWLSGVLLLVIVAARVIDFHFTRYFFDDRFVQIRKGALVVETFVTKRVKIQEIEVTHGWLQRKFNVASLHFHNRGKPLIVSELRDVPRETGEQFYSWFKKRVNMVKP